MLTDLSLSRSYALTHSLTHTLSGTLSLSLSHPHTLSFLHTHSLSVSFSLSLTHTHTNSLSQTRRYGRDVAMLTDLVRCTVLAEDLRQVRPDESSPTLGSHMKTNLIQNI